MQLCLSIYKTPVKDFMNSIWTITLLFLTGCAPVGKTFKVKVDKELLPYYQLFLDEAETHHKYLPPQNLFVFFVPSIPNDKNGNTILGNCTYGDEPTIRISRETWEHTDFDQREALLFHEFGHCILRKRHVDSEIEKDAYIIPSSLMNKFLLEGWIYHDYRSYYLWELFNRE